mgnify:FL=1
MKYNKKDYKTWSKAQKAKFLKIAEQHQTADRFIQGAWLQNEKIDWEFRGCFYGCMTQTKEDTLEEAVRVMNLPAWIIHVSEKIFEWLPEEEAIKFPLQLLEAIPTWLDTYQLWKDWSYILLMDKEHGNIKYCWDNQECIDAVKQVAELFKTDFTESAAWSAAESATESARSATESARSATESARSAAWSAAESAHYMWMRDTMIELLLLNWE